MARNCAENIWWPEGTFTKVGFFPHTINFRAPRCEPLSLYHWLFHSIRTDPGNMLTDGKYVTE